MTSLKSAYICVCFVSLIIFVLALTGAIIFSSGCDKNIHCSPANYKIVDFTVLYTDIFPTSYNNSYYLNIVGTYLTTILRINIKTKCTVYISSSNNYTYLELYADKNYPLNSIHKIFVKFDSPTECSLNSGTEYYIILGITIMSFSGFILIVMLVCLLWLVYSSYNRYQKI